MRVASHRHASRSSVHCLCTCVPVYLCTGKTSEYPDEHRGKGERVRDKEEGVVVGEVDAVVWDGENNSVIPETKTQRNQANDKSVVDDLRRQLEIASKIIADQQVEILSLKKKSR